MKELFLEDILRLTGFNNQDMLKYKEETQKGMKLLLTGLKEKETHHILPSGLVLISSARVT